MLWSEAITVGQEGEEVPLVVLHGACMLKGLEFAEVVRADRRGEAGGSKRRLMKSTKRGQETIAKSYSTW